MHLTRSGDHSITRCRGDILPKYQRQFKALKEKKNYLGIKGYQKGICCRKRLILTDLFSIKRRKVSVTSSSESNWVGYQVEENIKGESHDLFDVSGEILKFSLQTNELLGN